MPSFPFGPNPRGTLLYDCGRVMAFLFDHSRDASPYSSYCFHGWVSVNGTKVRHQIIKSANPNEEGDTVTQFAQIQGNVLTLVAAPRTLRDKRSGQDVLRWCKFDMEMPLHPLHGTWQREGGQLMILPTGLFGLQLYEADR